jgi:hypothetical protein
VESLCRLRLDPPSRWQVLLAIVATSARYGGRDARLSVAEIATMTGLCERTVKSAVADLIAAGLVRRVGRCRRFAVPLLSRPAPGDEESPLPLPSSRA